MRHHPQDPHKDGVANGKNAQSNRNGDLLFCLAQEPSADEIDDVSSQGQEANEHDDLEIAHMATLDDSCAESPESEIPSGYQYLAATSPQCDPSSGSGYHQAPAIDHTAAPSYVGITTSLAPEARRGTHNFGLHIAQKLRVSVGVRIHYNY